MQRFQKLLRLRAGAGVKRFHTFPIIGEQTVGHHSHAVAIFILTYHPNPSKLLLEVAINHDLAEYDVGDTPAQVKWKYPKISDGLHEAEAEISAKLDIKSEWDLEKFEDFEWFKLADTFEYCLYSLDQRNLGNKNMDLVFERGINRLETNDVVKRNADLTQLLTDLKSEYEYAKTSNASPRVLAIS